MTDPATGIRKPQTSFARRLYKLVTLRGATILTVLTLIVGIATQFTKFVELFKTPEKPPVAELASSCFKASVAARPNVMLVKNWESIRFLHMAGANGCKAPLTVHVTYRTDSSSVRIEPPFRDGPQCRGSYDISECWDMLTFDGGKSFDSTLASPKFTQLGHLPPKVLISWIVYNTDSKTKLRTGLTEVTVSEGI